MTKRLSLLFLIVVSVFTAATAQLIKIVDRIEAQNKTVPIEKLYLTFDKPYYSVGDTLWFKSFLLNGNFTGSQRTDKIYVELFDDNQKYIQNRVIALNNGLGYGDFALSEKLAEGTYTIRAYSNWQQNFGSDYFFQKTFYIGNASEKTWLLDSFQEINTTAANKTLDLKLRITNIKSEAVGLKDVEIYLMNRNKRLAKADLQTKLDGSLETKIPLETNKLTADYNIVIIDKKDKTKQSILPISLQKPALVDLQFMPEGGYMVNDIFGKVAFKAVGFDGLGLDLIGKIVNNANDSIAELKATHKGMGSFYLFPKKGENYTAIYNLNGVAQSVKLPIAKEDGTTLRIDQLSNPDSILLYLKASVGRRTDGYQLFAQSVGEHVLSIELSLKKGFANLKLPKKDFPDGIVHFTLFSPESIALNERQVFIDHRQKIDLQIKTDKTSYSIRDSVALEITAAKEDGTPLAGTFAISVTDDGQVKQKENEQNISSYFLLQSDLKGSIEEAGYYFKDQEPSTMLALDHLLLTQGWIGYNWSETIKESPLPSFKAEKGNVIEGKLSNLLKKPVPNSKLTLMALGKTIFVTDTISNSLGEFKFTDLPYLDSAAYSIKIKNAKGKTSLANIQVNEFKSAPDNVSFSQMKPWYVNADSALVNGIKSTNKPTINNSNKLKLEGNLLNEVEIKSKKRQEEFAQKFAWDSSLLKTIDEEELKNEPRTTLLDLLRRKVDGFTIGDTWSEGGKYIKHNFSSYLIGMSLIHYVVIDNVKTQIAAGVFEKREYNGLPEVKKPGTISKNDKAENSSERLELGQEETSEVNKYIFNALSASDIKNINVYKGLDGMFLDITTRSGKGPWIVNTAGMYVFRPLPVYSPKEFYSPKYNATNNSSPDYRSTIFWDANLVTDENGKAKLSFFTADKASNYTIKIEGTDLNGRFGFKTENITVKSTTLK